MELVVSVGRSFGRVGKDVFGRGRRYMGEKGMIGGVEGVSVFFERCRGFVVF